MSSAKERVSELSYGNERNRKDDLLTVFDHIAAEWQRDKDELARLREAIAVVNVFLNRDYEDMGVAQFQDDLRDALKEEK